MYRFVYYGFISGKMFKSTIFLMFRLQWNVLHYFTVRLQMWFLKSSQSHESDERVIKMAALKVTTD